MLIYTNIQHIFRKAHQLTCNEYIFLDMVYHLSTNPDSKIQGWCYATKEGLADEIGLSKQSIINLSHKLIDAGFLHKDEQTKFLKTTKKWNDVYFTDGNENLPTVKKVYRGGKESLPERGKESLPKHGKESLPYNNTLDNNSIDNNTDNNFKKTGEENLENNSNYQQNSKTQTPVAATPFPKYVMPEIKKTGCEDSTNEIYKKTWEEYQKLFPKQCLNLSEWEFIKWQKFVEYIRGQGEERDNPDIWKAGRFIQPEELKRLENDPALLFTMDKWKPVLVEMCGGGIKADHNIYNRFRVALQALDSGLLSL